MVSNSCLCDGHRVAACAIVMCILASSMLSGCAASPADDRRRLSPSGLRDAGRDQDYDNEEYDDEEVSPPRRARDASTNGPGSGSDAGAGPIASRPRDAGARLDAAPADARAPVDPAPPEDEPPRPPTEPDEADGPSDGATSGRRRDDAQVTAPPSRSRDGSDGSPSPGARPNSSSGGRDRSGRPSGRCWTSFDCPASACSLNELACCRLTGACGCRTGVFASCR